MNKIMSLLDINKDYCHALGICNEEAEFDSDGDNDNAEIELKLKDNLERRKVEDLTNKPFIEGEKDYEEVHPNLARIPFTYLINGARDSGKTVTTHSLLKFYHTFFDEIHIWSPTAELDFKWGKVIEAYEIPKNNIHKRYSEIFMKRIMKEIKKKNKGKPFSEKMNILFIFDDMITQLPKNKKFTAFNQLLLNNRHFNVSIMILSQSYHLLDSNVRKNASQLILFKSENLMEIKNFYEELSGAVGKENFIKLYEFATAEPHDFLYINYHRSIGDGRYMRNFDDELEVVEMDEF